MALMSDACARTSTADWPLELVDGVRVPDIPAGSADCSAAYSADSEYVLNGSYTTP
jgi:hypothetical protein